MTVYGKLLSPAASALAQSALTVTLVDYNNEPVLGFDTVGLTEVGGQLPVTVNADGTWTQALLPNAQIRLAGGTVATAWRITEGGAGASFTYWIVVVAGNPAVPVWVGDLVTTLVGGAAFPAPVNLALAGNLTVAGVFTYDGVTITAPPGITTKFLAGDGIWRTPAGAVGGVSSFNSLTGDVVATASTVGALAITADLADIADPVAARTNLGLGNSATRAVGTAAGTVAAGDDGRFATAVQSSTATAKGDLLAATAPGTIARLGVGPDGDLLVADSTQTSGMGWKVIPRDPSASKLGLVVQPFPIEACNRVGLGLSSGDLISPLGMATATTSVVRIGLWLTAAGSGPTGGSYAVIQDVAGNVLASSADITSQLTNAANVGTFVELVLTSSASVVGGVNYRPGILTQMSTNPKTVGTLADDGAFQMPSIRGLRPSVFWSGLSSVPTALDPAAASTAFAGYWITALGAP